MRRVISKILLMSKSLFRLVYLRVWQNKNISAGNIHMKAAESKLVKIPFSKNQVYIRPSMSDVARVREYGTSIYFSKTYLHDALRVSKPTILIDIGANIGLSSLSLIEEFNSLKKVIAIEAEEENFGVLQSNFRLWSKRFPNLLLEPMHAVATSDGDAKMTEQTSLAELTGNNSASGTFRFEADSTIEAVNSKVLPSISIQDLFDSFSPTESVMVKIDIEGGEEYLMSQNTKWVRAASFITMEIHDRFHPVMLNSSMNSIKALADGNFAITPSDDVLHCYNRDKLFCE